MRRGEGSRAMDGLLYDALIWPLERAILAPLRHDLLAPLRGFTVEIGAGTGLNFRHYAPQARVLAVEPNASMAKRASDRAARARAAVEVRVADDAVLGSLPEASVQTVVFVLVLCTVEDPLRALVQARRALAPQGRVVLLEHVRSPGRMGRWQDRIAPLWRRLADGCHLNRETAALVAAAGFDPSSLARRRIARWAPVQDVILGEARPAADVPTADASSYR